MSPLRPYLSAREIREPDFEATHPTAHPLSFLVDCPTGDSLDTSRCLAHMYCGTTFGQRPYTTWPKRQPLGNPRFVASRAVVFATGTCELDRKEKLPAHTGRRGQAPLPDARKTDSSKNIFRVGAAHLGLGRPI
jgi:hypothetical protein